MTLTALVGALVALVARPPEPQQTKDQEEIARLKRSHAQLIDRIETLELDNEGLGRELAAERNLSTHWIGEAARFAREAREARENAWTNYAQERLQQASQALQQTAVFQHAQQGQQAQQMQGQLMAYAQNQQQNAYPGFCNCVPARHQMFGIMSEVDGLVEQLNQLGR
jgi:hypothetical protein